MNKLVTLSVGLVLAATARGAHARAAYQTPEVMIANSEAIAIVQIDRIEAVKIKGTDWPYGQKPPPTSSEPSKANSPRP